MDEGVATFSGLFLDRSGWNLELRFSLYDYNRSTGDWNETGIHFDTEFFHVGEGVPAALLLEQVRKETPGFSYKGRTHLELNEKMLFSHHPP